MAGSEVTSSERRHRRKHNGHGHSDAADAPHNASDADTASSHSSKASKSKKRKHHHHKSAVSSPEASDADTASQSSKRSKKSKRRHADADARAAANGGAKRRPSLSQPARDPRDITVRKMKKLQEEEEEDKPVVRTPSPVIDFDGLSRPSRGTRERLEENPDQAAERLQKMQAAVRTILECVGEDPDRSGIVDTPKRYAKAMLDFTQGYQQNVGDIVNNAIFQEGHNEMVIVKDIEIFSLCEHHLVPFTGKVASPPLPSLPQESPSVLAQNKSSHARPQMHIAYIPKNQVIGISKLPRIAEMFSRRLQIQERLTKEVANAIMEVLKPQGVAVVMESSHLCMVMRGVQKTTASTITSCVLGCFETKSKTRNEFLSLVGLKKT
ncbi:GTP cyclohydrolase I [Verticillium dahliae]